MVGPPRALRTFPHVLEVHATTGREDLLIRIAAQSQEDLLLVLEHVTRETGHGRSAAAYRGGGS